MKRPNKITDPKRKRRYNLCHRLRERGVAINILTHSIEISEERFGELQKTARKYCDSLVAESRFQIQLVIGHVTDCQNLQIFRSKRAKNFLSKNLLTKTDP